MSKLLTEFYKLHDITVLDTNKRVAIRMPPRAEYFMSPLDYNEFTHYNKCEYMPVYTIEIPEHRMEQMAKFEQEVFNLRATYSHYNLFETLMSQKQEEQRLINNNIAVKKAYDHYSLMLSLAKAGGI